MTAWMISFGFLFEGFVGETPPGTGTPQIRADKNHLSKVLNVQPIAPKHETTTAHIIICINQDVRTTATIIGGGHAGAHE